MSLALTRGLKSCPTGPVIPVTGLRKGTGNLRDLSSNMTGLTLFKPDTLTLEEAYSNQRKDVHNHAMDPALQTRDGLESSWMIFPLAGAFAVVGAKIWLIANGGSPTPFLDQWVAEGKILYPKYFDGTLNIFTLIAPHNEHRILLTRLWSLMLIDVGGYWDSVLQMLANTTIIGALVAILIATFRPILFEGSYAALTLFTAAIFGLPFGWESTLAGFHSQWYFVMLFGIGSVLLFCEARAFSTRWWVALFLAVLSYFSMASGALPVAAAFAIGVIQFNTARRSGRREIVGLALLGVAFVSMVAFTPVLAHHAPLRAHSIGQFLRALLQIMSWPVTQDHASHYKVIGGAILLQAPSALVSIYVIWLRPPLADRRWLVVALTAWAVLQAIAVAFGRSVFPVSARYLEVFTVGIVVNFACLLYALGASTLPRVKRGVALGAAVWLLLVLFGATKTVFTRTLPEIADREAHTRAETENLRNFLATKDLRALQNKSFLDIPYPKAEDLAVIASQPIIRALLPPELIDEPSPYREQQRGLARFTGRPIAVFKHYALRWGVLLIPTGFALFLLGLSMGWRRDADTSPSIDRPGAG